MWRPLLILSTWIGAITGEPCSEPFATPVDYPDDASGLRTGASHPLAEGQTAVFTCPGAKRFKSSDDEWVKAADVVCEDGEKAYSFGVWPVCECYHDLTTSRCPKATYSTFYTDSYGETARTDIVMPIPEDVERWGLDVKFDVDVRALHVKAEGADMWIKDGFNLQLTRPNGTEANDDEAEIRLTYTFPGTQLQKVRPHWQHPCIESIDCLSKDYEDDQGSDGVWLIIGIAVAVIVALMIISFLVFYCVKRSGGGTKVELM